MIEQVQHLDFQRGKQNSTNDNTREAWVKRWERNDLTGFLDNILTVRLIYALH